MWKLCVVSAVVLLVASPLLAPATGPIAASLAGCPVFPDDNIWNTRVDTLPVHPRSADYINSIGADVGLHPDFGSGTFDGGPIGIPFTTIPGTQPRVGVTFDFADESDPGPYPIPRDAPIEGGPNSSGDRHILLLDRDNCVLYELYAAYPQPDGSWRAGSGAIYNLRSNALRPAGYTSADAAGLPLLIGLARYDEVASGEIRHALRFTARSTQRAFVWPARHFASSITDPRAPPMGQRFRLKASFDITPFPPEVQVILRALQRYGMMLADNGSNWFISGAPDPRWTDDALVPAFRLVRGRDFEAVDVSSLIVDPNSGQAGGAPGRAFLVPFSLDDGGLGGGGLGVTASTTSVHVMGARRSQLAYGTGPVNYVAGATVFTRAGSSGTLSVDVTGLEALGSIGAGSGYKAFVQFYNDALNFVAVGLINDPAACPLCGPSGMTLMVEGNSSLVSPGPIGGYWSNLVVPSGTHRFAFAWSPTSLSITLDTPTSYINPQPLVFPIVMTQPSITFMGGARLPGDIVNAVFQNITFTPALPMP